MQRTEPIISPALPALGFPFFKQIHADQPLPIPIRQNNNRPGINQLFIKGIGSNNDNDIFIISISGYTAPSIMAKPPPKAPKETNISNRLRNRRIYVLNSLTSLLDI